MQMGRAWVAIEIGVFMETKGIQTLTQTFESYAQRTDDGVEYWLARDVQHLLGCTLFLTDRIDFYARPR